MERFDLLIFFDSVFREEFKKPRVGMLFTKSLPCSKRNELWLSFIDVVSIHPEVLASDLFQNFLPRRLGLPQPQKAVPWHPKENALLRIAFNGRLIHLS